MSPVSSILIIARNEGEWLGKMLDSLYAVTTDIPFEVLIYDDHSTDGCVLNLAPFPNMRLVPTTNAILGVASARNYVASFARGEYFIFCDGHLEFKDWWLDMLLLPLLEREYDAVNPIISSIIDPTVKGYAYRWDAKNCTMTWGHYAETRTAVAGLAGGCIAIRNEVFIKVGMFDGQFIIWGMEDAEFGLRLALSGYRMGIEPAVDVGHYFKEVNDYGTNWFNYNYNHLRLLYLHLDENSFEYAYTNCLQDQANPAEKLRLRTAVLNEAQHRKQFCQSIAVLTYEEYLKTF